MHERSKCYILTLLTVTWLLFTPSFSTFAAQTETGAKVRPGVEMLLSDHTDLIAGKRVGLITNMTGVASDGTHIADLLMAHPEVELVAFFAPEHGLRGDREAGVHVPSYVDDQTGLPVFSLYGSTMRPTSQMLSDVDTLIFDIQDVGARFYTYIYTMAYAMEGAAEHGINFIVLDRPNPIGGLVVEGPILDSKFSSFVGLYPIALRHGMTVGELASLFNETFGIHVDLTVVKMQGWTRDMWFDDTGLPWVPPSPNMVTLDTAIVYPGMALIEGTNVSEGRGTAAPFETIGAPWIDGEQIAEALNNLDLDGVRFRPASFTPTFSKFQGVPSEGIHVEVTDRDVFRPVTTGLFLIRTLKTLYPEQFQWRPPSGGQYFFDLLAGNSTVRQLLDEEADIDHILQADQITYERFLDLRSQFLLY